MNKRIHLITGFLLFMVIARAQETIWSLENQYMINLNNRLQTSSDNMQVETRSKFNWNIIPTPMPIA